MDGFITSTAQDVLNRRPISLERGGQSAIAGNLFAGLAGIYGRRQSNALTTNQKGELGETLGDIRSAMNGRIRDRTSKKYDYFKDILEIKCP